MADEVSIEDEIERITVDCYDENEIQAAWECTFQDEVNVPFSATLLGMPVEVRAFRVNNSGTAQCQVITITPDAKKPAKERWIGIEDLDDEGLPSDMAHLLKVYRAYYGGGD